MTDFTYHNPTKIEFGKGKEKNIAEHINNYGIKKVLLCYGSDRIKKNALLSSITERLESYGIEYVSFSGIISNPILSKVYEGIKLAKDSKVDAILSIGGGSVLDSSKAIAVGASTDIDIWDFFIGKKIITNALPLFDIMTLAATGSEMNGFSVITNEKTKQKYFILSEHIYPKISIINPELMKTVSKEYLIYSASDIIAHAIEGYFTATTQAHFSSRLVESIIKTVIETTDILIQNPSNYEARAEFAWASTQALNGLIYAGTDGYSYPNHMIEHSLSALYNVPHGAGLSVVIPAWMKWYYTKNEKQFKRFSEEIFGLNSAIDGIEALEKWFNKIGTPTRLTQLNINKNDRDAIIENILENAKYFGIDDIYNKQTIIDILEKA